jgi:hypothetical protein
MSGKTTRFLRWAAALVVVGAAAPAWAGTSVVHSDFEDGTSQGWAAVTSPAVVTNTSAMAHTGSRSLLTSGRSATSQGPALDVTSSLRTGIRYQISVWVRAAGVAANVNLTVGQKAGTRESSVQVVSNVPVGSTRWVRLRGTYAPSVGYDHFRVRVETGDSLAPFYIDDLVVTALESAQPPVITSPASGSVVTANRPTITGVGPPDTVVTLVDRGSVVCTARVSDAGDWRCAPASGLSLGAHTVVPTARDALGTATAGAPVTFTVNAVGAPPTPQITWPAPNSTLATALPTITGTGPSGAKVTAAENGRTVCTATVRTDGIWLCTPTKGFSEGQHVLSATAREGTGPVSSASWVRFGVDTVWPKAPTITGPADRAVVNTVTPVVAGTAEAGVTVRVTVDGVAACETTAANDGNWSCTPEGTVPTGSHSLAATATDAAGNWATSQTTTFSVSVG